LKTVAAVAAQKAGMLRITTRAKRMAAVESPTMKGKQDRVDVGAPLASTTHRKVSVRPPDAMEANDGRVAYSALLDSVPSVDLCSLSSSDSSSSESILASPPPILDLHISVELPEMPEVEAAKQEAPVEIGAHVTSPEG
jgi:hypothetical protein